MRSMHACMRCDRYICANSSCLLCINAIVGSAKLLRHDTHRSRIGSSDAQEDAQEARCKLGKCTMSKCSTTCCVLMLLDDLSKQWMYEYAQAARRKLGKCATSWDVMISCAAGCAAGSCYKQCMLIDRDVNCVHVASSSSRALHACAC